MTYPMMRLRNWSLQKSDANMANLSVAIAVSASLLHRSRFREVTPHMVITANYAGNYIMAIAREAEKRTCGNMACKSEQFSAYQAKRDAISGKEG